MKELKIFGLLKTLAIFTLAIFIVSCSDDDNGNNNDDDNNGVYPTSDGSYWIGERYSLDDDNNPVGTSPRIDSIVVKGNANKDGKTCKNFVTYEEFAGQWKIRDTVYKYADDAKMYVHADIVYTAFDLSGMNIELPLEPDSKWFLVADDSQTQWEVAAKTFDIEKDTVNVGGFLALPLDGSLTINCELAGTENINIDGTDYSAKKFTLNFAFSGKVDFGGEVAIELDRNWHFWFVDDVGEVKTELETLSVDITELSIKETLDGFQRTCVRYNIK